MGPSMGWVWLVWIEFLARVAGWVGWSHKRAMGSVQR